MYTIASSSSSSDSEQPQPVRSKKPPNSSKQEWNRQRKMTHAWTSAENSLLIAAVRKRRALWDGGSPEYKSSQVKSDCWKAVAEVLATQGIDANEAKLKWNSVRSNFKSYLAKHRALKSGQGAVESFTVAWPHFKELMFIEYAEERASNDTAPSSLRSRSGQRRKRKLERTAPSSPAAASQSCGDEPPDRYSEFGNLVAARLRYLQPDFALALETHIGEKLNDVLERNPQPTSPMNTQAPKRELREDESLTNGGIKVDPDEDLTDLTQDGSEELHEMSYTPAQPPNLPPVDHHSESTHIMEDVSTCAGSCSRLLLDDECSLYGALLIRKLRKFSELDRSDVMLAIDTLVNARMRLLLRRQMNGDASK